MLKEVLLAIIVIFVAVSVYPFLWFHLVYAPKARRLGCGLPKARFEWPLGLKPLHRVLVALRTNTINQYFVQLFTNLAADSGLTQVAGQIWMGTIDAENVKTILAVSFNDYTLGFRHGAMHSLLGDGIFTLSGQEWKHSRALLKPQFAKEQVSHLDDLRRHINKLIGRLSSEEVLDVQELYHCLTIDSATEFLFGESTNALDGQLATRKFEALRGTVTGTEFVAAYTSALEMLAYRVVASAGWFLIWTPKFWRDCRTCHNFIDYFVHRALETPLEKNEVCEKYVFIRELTRETRDASIIRDQAFNVLLAGRDTTASLLSFTTYYLGRYTAVYDELREAVLAHFGSRDAPVTFEALKRCKYLQSVLSEVLRLHPAVPLNFRTAIRDTVLPRGGGPQSDEPLLVLKNQTVLYAPHVMHRNPKVWGPDADEFRPSRWLEKRQHGAWDYIPFNGGPRICLGQQFALTEASYTLVRICQEFRAIELVQPDPHHLGPLPEKLRLTTSVPGGVVARFHLQGPAST